MAIQSFADANTEKVWRRQHVARLGTDIQRAAQKKLRLLNAAGTLGDLRVPPGNRLEKLTGTEPVSTRSESTTSSASASPGPRAGLQTSRSSTTTRREAMR